MELALATSRTTGKSGRSHQQRSRNSGSTYVFLCEDNDAGEGSTILPLRCTQKQILSTAEVLERGRRRECSPWSFAKPINLPHTSLTSDSKRKKPPGATLRCDGRLTTPSACIDIVKVFVGLRDHDAPVRNSGHRGNRSCTAFADKFRVFSFDFMGLQPTSGVTGRYSGHDI
jgi:hypothetical protein